ncbi:MAG: hypothetical protein AAFU03_06765 [Bacteroidota bacterium]
MPALAVQEAVAAATVQVAQAARVVLAQVVLPAVALHAVAVVESNDN